MTLLEAIEAALLAPTAVQAPKGRCQAGLLHDWHTKMDLGIVKYHFELGAGKENFEWV